MSIWAYIILFLTVIAGGLTAVLIKNYNAANLRLVLSFSGSYILGITILHLMPGVYTSVSESAGLWVLLGFFIQLLLEQFSKGVEHGHIHKGHKHPNFAASIMLGLCLHAFLEGLPLSNYTEFHQLHHGAGHDDNHLFFGIIVHKAPAAFALVTLFLWSNRSLFFVILNLFIFALMSPLGAFTSALFSPEPEVVAKMVALVIGSFLHISTTILFEADDSHQHKIPWKKMLAILIGMGLALLTI